MAEPIGAISGVAGLIIFATNLSVGISRRIDAVRGLPRTLQALSADLKGFVSVLGTLQGYLDHEDTKQGVLHPGTVDELADVLEDCIRVFTELNQQLNRDLNGSGEASVDAKMSAWRRLRLSFRDKDFEELRAKLAARKLTLTVAVSVANFINTSSHVGMTWQMQSDLQVMKAEVSAVLQRLETMQASASLPAVAGTASTAPGSQGLSLMRRRSGSHKRTSRAGSRQGHLVSETASVNSSLVSFHTAASAVLQTAVGVPTSPYYHQPSTGLAGTSYQYQPAGTVLHEMDGESTYEQYDTFTRRKSTRRERLGEDQAAPNQMFDEDLAAPVLSAAGHSDPRY
ncbi:hypothetical protein VD0002_g914 [Verticillium dahliae]|nr:hypothetical protein BJF96_g1143 [Verticillium dahliae]PNH56818.1 hypothetical protein VD0003_g907 [Verticillium dahliae]PNH69501.1 hypothetical protein VD0002_g914 [Verticillium dahliae]